jgi:DNA-binding SARP family transcriptional activator
MSALRICLFGKFSVSRNGRELEGLDARKVQELFCYLLLHRDHTLPRETLASVLWPETTTTLAKKSLRQALWQLQSAIVQVDEQDSQRVLLVEPERIGLNEQSACWLDAAALEQAFMNTQKIVAHELSNQQAQLLRNAVDLYQGPLLEGWYADWCLYERERLQSMYLAMLDKLMSYCETQRDYETGLLYGMRIMCYDRARERTHRRMMRLHYLNGDRSSALRQFEQCAAALDEELNAIPSKNTVALYEQIRADQLDEPEPASTFPEISLEISEYLLPTILTRLLQLQAALTDLQNQVGQSIQALEQALATYSPSDQQLSAN